MSDLTISRLLDVQAAYAERLFLEVTLPGLKASFVNVDDKAAQEILRDTKKAETVRDRAFRKLMLDAMPLHMRPDEATVTRERVEPLAGISVSAARGIVQAVNESLVSHANWIQIHHVFEQIRVTAGDREP